MSALIDPRRGVPSASAMHRLSNCPASWQACQGLPDETNDDSDSGTRIHKALETGDYTSISSLELETVDMCQRHRLQVVEGWVENFDECIVFTELRLGLTAIGGVVTVSNDTTVPLLFTGQSDLIVFDKAANRALVVDYKTGRGDYEHAIDNVQLRALAVLVAKRWRLSSVRVAIVQPWVGKPTVADFDADALAAASGWLTGTLLNVNAATPDDLNAGDWCQWCKAKATCPKLRDTALAPVDRMSMGILSMDDATARAALFARAMELPADTLAGLMKGLRLVGWYANAIEGAAKKRAENDVEFQQFYRIKSGVVREKITDVQTVFQRVNALGVTPQEFTAACSLTKKELETMVRKATNTKGRTLDAELAKVLEGATESKETAPQLEEVTA